MNFGDIARKRLSFFAILLAALAVLAVPQAAVAAAAPAADAQAENVADDTVPAASRKRTYTSRVISWLR